MALTFRIEGTPAEVERLAKMHPRDLEREIHTLLEVLVMRNADGLDVYKLDARVKIERHAADARKAARRAVRALMVYASSDGPPSRKGR